MAYTISEKVFIGGLSVMFCMIVIGFVALIYSASIWAKNKRNERIEYAEMRQQEISARANHEREEWMELLKIKDEKISSLTAKLNETTRLYEINKQLLEQSERERLRHGKRER